MRAIKLFAQTVAPRFHEATCSRRTSPAARRAARLWTGEAAAARPAAREAGEQVRSTRCPGRRPARPACASRCALRESRMRRRPQLLRDDPELRRRHPHPLAGRPVPPVRLAPPVALPRLVPDDLAAVERPEQHLAHGAGGPGRAAVPVAAAAPSAPSAFSGFGDPRQPVARRAQLEDPPHDRGLGLVDPPLDVRARAVRRRRSRRCRSRTPGRR